MEDGHILMDESGPRFRAVAHPSPRDIPAGSAMHNPYGRLRLVSMKDAAEAN
jgi:hypothetical protein